MPNTSFAAELDRLGPESLGSLRFSADDSRRYCRRLAQSHYENFSVASRLVPRQLRQHFYNVYAYCRWADDLADETGDPARALGLLDWWAEQLDECYRGEASHPVFIALAETIERFAIPSEPFADLLVAFRRDQRITRYETNEQLLDYCRYSANPVGRLVLYLGRCFSPARAELADCVCTGLQLANFCQDVAGDWQRGRIYLPLADCRRFGYDQPMFARHEPNQAFRRLMTAKVGEAETWLRRGLPLVGQVAGPLRLQVSLFIEGGLAILDAIRRQDYDVWSYRPKLSKLRKLRLFARCWWSSRHVPDAGNTL